MDSAPRVLELEPTPEPPGGPVLVVVHPDENVRHHVLAAAPAELLPLAVPRPEQVRLWLREAPGVLVVAFDPARTPAHDVRAGLPDGARVHLLSVSDLQLDAPDPAVDSALPRRRLTRASLLRHLRTVGLTPSPGTPRPGADRPALAQVTS
ncbi:hypothetical protein [Aquipuribacter sp. SD81]|uniref:hypothetical protein n=1 Tax=Aquipuribacter sp. SD81 TaxID=3127703 RepID=UPI00301AB4E4